MAAIWVASNAAAFFFELPTLYRSNKDGIAASLSLLPLLCFCFYCLFLAVEKGGDVEDCRR